MSQALISLFVEEKLNIIYLRNYCDISISSILRLDVTSGEGEKKRDEFPKRAPSNEH